MKKNPDLEFVEKAVRVVESEQEFEPETPLYDGDEDSDDFDDFDTDEE